MRALVMAAGLGTRLRPLTDHLPKPLVPVNGKPMVEYVLELLSSAGVREAIINIHYLPGKMRAFAEDWNRRGALPQLVLQDESDLILGSGGAVAKAFSWLFESDTDALVCNADVLAWPDLKELKDAHFRAKERGVECTLAVMAHPEAGGKYTGLKVEHEKVLSFERSAGKGPLFHFPGFYLISREGAARLPAQGPSSVVDVLWKPLAKEGKLGAWLYRGEYLDLGTVKELEKAEKFLESRGISG